jgi:hypothetical protein
MTDSCAICIEPYNGRRVKVTCQYCPTAACRGCQQTYLTQTYQDPHCMECKRGWSAEFMAANFPLSFRNDTLRKWRRRILVEREKAMLPMMQQYVEWKRELQAAKAEDAALRAQLDQLEKNYKKASYAYYAARRDFDTERLKTDEHRVKMEEGDTTALPLLLASKKLSKELGQKSKQLYAEYMNASKAYRAKKDEVSVAYNRMYRAQGLYTYGAAAATQKGVEKREFIMKCPDEGCRGFLSNHYKCGTCDKHTCTDCLEVIGLDKDAPHECNKDTVESAKAIKSETRPCPKCGTRIFKVDGCDMMWCTMDGCGTAFSWNTGKVETGRIHNPHYYEWLRRNGGGMAPRELGDIPCGGMPHAGELYRLFSTGTLYHLQLINAQVQGKIMEIHRCVEDIIHIRMPDYRVQMGPTTNKDVDVQYLMQDIDAEEWQRQLEFTEARMRRKQEIGMIMQMATTAAADIFRRITVELPTMEPVTVNSWLESVILAELEQLRVFVNNAFVELAKRQKQAVPNLGFQWKWQPVRALYKATAAST